MAILMTGGENGEIPFSERKAFVGCFIRQETKDALKAEGKDADRPLTWVINRILENYINDKEEDARC